MVVHSLRFNADSLAPFGSMRQFDTATIFIFMFDFLEYIDIPKLLTYDLIKCKITYC